MSQAAGTSSRGLAPLRLLATRVELRMFLLTLLVMAVLSLASPYFLTRKNLLNIMDQSVVTGLVAAGQTLVILIGGIDLSVGSLVGLTGIILGLSFTPLGLWGAMLACLATGALAGFVNGALIRFGRVAPFVMTLGMMSVGRSLSYVFSGATSISNIPDGMGILTNGAVFGMPVDFVALIIIYALFWVFLGRAKGGRTLYAIGSNSEAARVAGLNIGLWTILAYTVSGLMSGLAALFLTSRIFSIDPVAGTGLELDSIAAVVIGGASLFGGRGSIIGTLLACSSWCSSATG